MLSGDHIKHTATMMSNNLALPAKASRHKSCCDCRDQPSQHQHCKAGRTCTCLLIKVLQSQAAAPSLSGSSEYWTIYSL